MNHGNPAVVSITTALRSSDSATKRARPSPRKAHTPGGTRRYRRSIEVHRRTAQAIGEAVNSRWNLLLGVQALREMGPPAVEVTNAVLALRPVRELHLSWQLFEALAEGDGVDPEGLLEDVLDDERLEDARTALFGDPKRFTCVPLSQRHA